MINVEKTKPPKRAMTSSSSPSSLEEAARELIDVNVDVDKGKSGVSITLEDELGHCEEGRNDGKQTAVEGSINDWPAIAAVFSQFHSGINEDGSERTPYQCAEPHALAAMLNTYTQEQDRGDILVERDLFNSLFFTNKARDHEHKAYMQPCAVCQQWVRKSSAKEPTDPGGAIPLAGSPIFSNLPKGPIISAMNKRRAANAARVEEEALLRVARETRIFDEMDLAFEHAAGKGLTVKDDDVLKAHNAAKKAQLAERHEPRLVRSLQTTSSYIIQIADTYPDATNKQKKGIEKDFAETLEQYQKLLNDYLSSDADSKEESSNSSEDTRPKKRGKQQPSSSSSQPSKPPKKQKGKRKGK